MTSNADGASYDVVVVGSGFGGSLMAMICRRLGLEVLLLEKDRHPRFAIGESTSPLANLLLDSIAERYDLPRLRPMTEFGSWQRAYPDLVCGLKRGFTFLGHRTGSPFVKRGDRGNELLVAASPNDDVSDMHWLRSDVDAFFMQEAVKCGADYRDGVRLHGLEPGPDGTSLVHGRHDGEPLTVRARLVIDAGGPRGFVSGVAGLSDTGFRHYPATSGLFTHFKGVRRCDSMPEYEAGDEPPYRMDDAALHHLFDGGWMWVLRFRNGLTSAGASMEASAADKVGLSDGAPAWDRLLQRFPSIRRQFDDAVPVRPWTYASRLAYRASTAAGPGWVLLPSAAAFVDPLFSTGFPLTLLGIERLGRILEEVWGTDRLVPRLNEYAETTLAEADLTAEYIGICLRTMSRFSVFSELSMFYFAAASFSELARRLESPLAPRRFLAADQPEFIASMRKAINCVTAAESPDSVDIDELRALVRNGISGLNVAGLCDPSRRNWYPVDLNAAVCSAHLLGTTPERLRETLRFAPWAQPNDI